MVQLVEMLEAKPFAVLDELAGDYIHVNAQWQKQKFVHVLVHVLGQQVEVVEELPVAEQDVQEDFDIEGEEVQIQIQGAVQSDDG